MTQVTHFGYLGNDFQLKVLSQILCDKSFGLNIIDIIQPIYFDNQHFRRIATILKNHYNKFNNVLPTISGLKESIAVDVKDQIEKEYLLSYVNILNEKSLEDVESTQDRALKFCKQQEMKKAVAKVEDIMKRGDFESYDLIDEIIRNAQAIGENKDDAIDLDDDFDGVMAEDYRKPQSTGIDGLDIEIDGGLARGELGLLLIPQGIGKSTLLTKFANTGYDNGLHVLHLYFEDKHKAIQRKHYTCASGIPMRDLPKAKDFVRNKIDEQKTKGGSLKLKKCKFGTTVKNIRQYINYRRNKGIKTDMLVLDYVDCLSGGKTLSDETGSESTIIRELEALADELDIILWTAVQGNRSSIGADIVTADQVQGSIKRTQVAHLIISVNKTLQQKELNLATLAILKIRFGGTGEGKVFENMTFNNGTMEFNTEENSLVSISTYETNKEKKKDEESALKASQALEKFRENKLKAQAINQ